MVDLLLLGVLAPVALDLDDEVQQVIVAVAVIHQNDEVRKVPARLRAEAIRHFKAEVVILDVGAHPRMRLGHAAELAFPVAIENHPVDVAAAGARSPSDRSCEVLKFTWLVEPIGIVGIEHALIGRLPMELAGDGGGDALAGHVRQLLIHELRRDRCRPCRPDKCPATPW